MYLVLFNYIFLVMMLTSMCIYQDKSAFCWGQPQRFFFLVLVEVVEGGKNVSRGKTWSCEIFRVVV